MMNTRSVNRLLNVHAVIDDVGNHIEHRIYDCRATGAANGKPEAAVFS